MKTACTCMISIFNVISLFFIHCREWALLSVTITCFLWTPWCQRRGSSPLPCSAVLTCLFHMTSSQGNWKQRHHITTTTNSFTKFCSRASHSTWRHVKPCIMIGLSIQTDKSWLADLLCRQCFTWLLIQCGNRSCVVVWAPKRQTHVKMFSS